MPEQGLEERGGRATLATQTDTPRTHIERVERRTVWVLFIAQMISGLGMGAGMSIGSLLAYEVTQNEGLAGVARIVSGLGVALFAVPLVTLARARGRRFALGTGWLISSVGAAVLVAAVAFHSLPLLMVGMLGFAAGSASGLQARFAATDLARPEHRARTLSLIVWATTAGSVLGPNLAAPGALLGRRFHIADIAGAYMIASGAVAVAALFVMIALRPDPLLLSPGHTTQHRRVSTRRTLGRMWAHPSLRLALLAMVCSQFTMTAVMVLTPVHMKLTGHSLAAVAQIMSIHIAGMYAFSPLVGMAVDRVGSRAITFVGTGVLGASLVAAWFARDSFVALSVALFLLGIGWSLATVAGASLLTRSAIDDERLAMQGTADTMINLTAALAAGVAGPVMAVVTFRGLAGFAAIALIPMLWAALTAKTRMTDHQPDRQNELL